MKLFSAEQIRQLDADTIRHTPIASIDLMEKASEAFVRWFCSFYVPNRKVSIFCGKGNNGGDGLAIARLLIQKGFLVEVHIIEYTEKCTEGFTVNLKRLNEILQPKSIYSLEDTDEITPGSIIIDAMLGTGVQRPVTGLLAEVITKLNTATAERVSVDIATGLYTDSPNNPEDIIFQPHQTVSFEFPKLAFLLPQNALFTGEWHIVSIGLLPQYIQNTTTNYYYTTEQAVSCLIRHRTRFSHKGTFGHTLIIAGSYGKMGAAILSAGGCLRSGAGLTTLYIPGCGYQIIQIARPEAMVITDPLENFISEIPELTPYASVAVGPGIGTAPSTLNAIEKLMDTITIPLVIDADGLNLLSRNRHLLDKLPENTILTPHPKEFERLAGQCSNDFERLERAREFAQQYKIILILKGAYTAVISKEGITHFNSTGNSGMATGGSGDVLTGIIAGLLAQKYTPLNAAILAVFQHGMAGEFASQRRSPASIIASDLVNALGYSPPF